MQKFIAPGCNNIEQMCCKCSEFAHQFMNAKDASNILNWTIF